MSHLFESNFQGIPFGAGQVFLGANLGIDNNNPGNIWNDPNVHFQGEITPNDTHFKKFISMPYGYRALIKNLQAYINGGTDTIYEITHKWAPWGEGNNPDSYALHVSQRTGISQHTPIAANDLQTLGKIAAAIFKSETGADANQNDINAAISLLQAGGTVATTSMMPAPESWAKRNKNWLVPTAVIVGVYAGVKLYDRYYGY